MVDPAVNAAGAQAAVCEIRMSVTREHLMLPLTPHPVNPNQMKRLISKAMAIPSKCASRNGSEAKQGSSIT